MGLYLHLPFCARICHYCDFVKSALYTEDQKTTYLKALEDLLDNYLRVWPEIPGVGREPSFSSVFWGGGTPSLVTTELSPIMTKIMAKVGLNAEVTLEANPEHVTDENLEIWKGLGVNRLSLGIQSFQDKGLRALTREHSSKTALDAVNRALSYGLSVNVDLIYGWPGQTPKDWEDDLMTLGHSGVSHASLYCLTFEGQTPFARRLARGRMKAMDDERLFGLYERACTLLRKSGFEHEEVSNWHRPGEHARHNSLYWHGGSYLGLGSGAHSYLEKLGPYGTRYQQNGNWRTFVSEPLPSLQSIMEQSYISIDADRDAEAWILERVSSGLRTVRGINIAGIAAESGYSFEPRPVLLQAFDQGLFRRDSSDQLYLDELEWFRETQWSLEVSLSFVPNDDVESRTP
jgi:oxygen-independent coproporphyrinogen-3 oxidase